MNIYLANNGPAFPAFLRESLGSVQSTDRLEKIFLSAPLLHNLFFAVKMQQYQRGSLTEADWKQLKSDASLHKVNILAITAIIGAVTYFVLPPELALPSFMVVVITGVLLFVDAHCLETRSHTLHNASILLNSPYKEIIESQGDHGVVAALWLLALAKPEERFLVPTLLSEMSPLQKSESAIAVEAVIRLIEMSKNVRFDQSTEKAREIAEEAIWRIKTVTFHGTHVRHFESICQTGLSLDKIENDPACKKLHKIAVEKLGNKMFFGCSYPSCEIKEEDSVERRLYVSSSAISATNYAERSPGWVSQFFLKGYETRDYNQAKEYLEERLRAAKVPLTIEEANEFRAFFEKTWESYKEKRPLVFSVHIPFPKDITAQELLDLYVERVKSEAISLDAGEGYFLRRAVERVVQRYCDYIDVPLEESVPAKDVTPFFIPSSFGASLF